MEFFIQINNKTEKKRKRTINIERLALAVCITMFNHLFILLNERYIG